MFAIIDFISRPSSRLRIKDSNIYKHLRTMKLDKVGASTVTKHSKAYWLPRVFRPVVDGAQVDNYCARMSCSGVQRSLSLRTPNGEEAAQIARDWFVFLSTNDWEAFD